ncbi:Fido domain profile [Propionibacterium ruminifibrarum]|uniref:Fido domain profile n=1 Tax=Propionibacterium ruminifibrarum TaxID=1962131 RepID=A0A375HZU3_9ACTN|nr:Fic family protein [Propionibacterium ruminifibrarum]SPF67281.1 Fido domain profile [Propionibacterium ruminifibrarum]
MTEFLTAEDLRALTDDLGVGPVRDLGLLESAAHRPTTSLWGQEAYPSLELKAAALMDSVVNTHPLVDGNERLGWLATLVFLDVNGVWIEAPDDDAYDLVIAVASGSAGLSEVAEALVTWSRSRNADDSWQV